MLGRLLQRGSCPRLLGQLQWPASAVAPVRCLTSTVAEGDWETVVGLEVHCQLRTKSKLFSGSSTEFGSGPNSQVALLDAAIPGSLPVINAACVEKAVILGLAMEGKIQHRSVFERKHYFYPDLPLGYQITQRLHPVVTGGQLKLGVRSDDSGEELCVRLVQIQLEQDSGKSVHDITPGVTHIDLNRAGIALVEIVSEPDIRCAQHAGEFVKKLQLLVRHLGVCDGSMEKGSLRCDANVSVRRRGSTEYGERVEVKNLNSIRHIVRSIEHEAARQVALIESGGKVARETRLYDPREDLTVVMRTKEMMTDYRFMPEPDLPPLLLDDSFIEGVRSRMPELPDACVERLNREHGLPPKDAAIIVSLEGGLEYYEAARGLGADPKQASNWMINELLGRLYTMNVTDVMKSPLEPARLSELLGLIEGGTISGKMGKDVVDAAFAGDTRPCAAVVKDKGWGLISNHDELHDLCKSVVDANPDQVKKFKAGRDRVFGFFVGQVMKQTKGQAAPQIVDSILRDLLK